MTRSRLTRLALITFIGLSLLWSSWAEAGVGMAVSPSRFRFKKRVGEVAAGTVSIKNSGTYAIQIATEIADMGNRRTPEGFSIRDEVPPGTTSYSCAPWIRLVEGEGAVIPAGQSAKFNFVVSPPPEIKAGGYGAYLFFIGSPAQRAGAKDTSQPQVQLVTVPRLGVTLIYEVEGTIQRKGELSKLEFTAPQKGQPMKFLYEFVNTGNAEVVLTGNFHVMDSENRLAGKGSLKAIKTFPGERGLTETTWEQPLPPGKYTLLVTFELGPDAEEGIVKELHFDIP